MAEINKLAVGEALDKLRRPDVQSKQTRVDEKMTALDEDIRRMRATRRRLERDQRAAELSARKGEQQKRFVLETLVAGHSRCCWLGPFGLNHPLCDAGAINAIGASLPGANACFRG